MSHICTVITTVAYFNLFLCFGLNMGTCIKFYSSLCRLLARCIAVFSVPTFIFDTLWNIFLWMKHVTIIKARWFYIACLKIFSTRYLTQMKRILNMKKLWSQRRSSKQSKSAHQTKQQARSASNQTQNLKFVSQCEKAPPGFNGCASTASWRASKAIQTEPIEALIQPFSKIIREGTNCILLWLCNQCDLWNIMQVPIPYSFSMFFMAWLYKVPIAEFLSEL